MKSGWQSGATGTTDPLLRWNAASATQWNTTWEAGVWHNVAYEIDFDAGSVAFWHSTGAEDLVLTVPAVIVSASSDGKDWHLGVLELPRDGYADSTEDMYFSGVYVESGDLTTSIAGPGNSAAPVASASGSATSAISVASTPVLSVSSTAASSIIATSAVAPIATSSAIDIGSSTTMATLVRSTSSAQVSVTSSAAISNPTSFPIDEGGDDDDDDEC